MIIDGRALARAVLERTRVRVGALSRTPHVVAYVAPAQSAVTSSYLRIKERSAREAGCEFSVTHDLADASGADAFIVQLPLPSDMDTARILDAIPIEKDADVLSTSARMKFEADEPDTLMPPVAAAVAEILKMYQRHVQGRKAVVIGTGWLVGKPCATLLSHLGAEVTHLTSKSGDLTVLREADIIVSGAGSPHLIKPHMIKEGAILIDAGTSEAGGVIAGDADPSCAEKCALFTPVPGGVGPLAVAKLFENAVTLAESQSHSS